MTDSSTTISIAFNITLATCLLLPGLFTVAMPWLTPRGEAFAVTVPALVSKDPRVRRLRAGYATAVLALTFLCLAMGLWAGANIAAFVGASLALPTAGFLGMLVCRQRVLALKKSEGWQVEEAHSATALLPGSAPAPLPLRWNLLYVPIILATVALIVALYPTMPEQIPMQAGFDGQVNSWADKSPLSVAFPLAMQLFLAVIMIVCHAGILMSRKPSGGSKPVATALAYGRFAQLQSIVLLGMGLALSASMVFIVLSDAGLMGLSLAGILVLIVTLVAVVASAGVGLWCGQSGSRLLDSPAGAGDPTVDEDERWKAGVFYVNRDDPSCFVPKRFGVGWTVNLGSWSGRAFILGIAVLTVAFVAVIFAMVG